MDLSKAFDCLPHELIIAKLHAYGLDHDSLRLISYLSNRHQKIKLDSVKFFLVHGHKLLLEFHKVSYLGLSSLTSF